MPPPTPTRIGRCRTLCACTAELTARAAMTIVSSRWLKRMVEEPPVGLAAFQDDANPPAPVAEPGWHRRRDAAPSIGGEALPGAVRWGGRATAGRRMRTRDIGSPRQPGTE